MQPVCVSAHVHTCEKAVESRHPPVRQDFLGDKSERNVGSKLHLVGTCPQREPSRTRRCFLSRTPNSWLLWRIQSPGDSLGDILVLPAQLDGQWADTADAAEKVMVVRAWISRVLSLHQV